MARNLVSTTHPLISLDAVQVRSHCISIYRIYSSFFINRSLKSFCVTFYSIFMVLSCCSPSRRGATVETHTLSLSFFRNVQCSLMATLPKMFKALGKSNTISSVLFTCIQNWSEMYFTEIPSSQYRQPNRTDHRHNAHRTRKVLFNGRTTTIPDRCKP